MIEELKETPNVRRDSRGGDSFCIHPPDWFIGEIKFYGFRNKLYRPTGGFPFHRENNVMMGSYRSQIEGIYHGRLLR